MNLNSDKIKSCYDSSFTSPNDHESQNSFLSKDARMLIERNTTAKNSIYINGEMYHGYLNGQDVSSWLLPNRLFVPDNKQQANDID